MASVSSASFKDIPLPTAGTPGRSARISHGKLFAPQQLIMLFSPDDWEAFIQEWIIEQRTKYKSVVRFSGANDLGIDIAGFTDDKMLEGVWDNFQCKHYAEPITPSTAILEIGKIIWYSYKKEYKPPRKHYFIAPKDCGIKLKKQLSNVTELKKYVTANWDKYCRKGITGTEEIILDGDFKKYFDKFKFSIFAMMPCIDIISDHRKTPWYADRFGGGLPDRPAAAPAPIKTEAKESRYLEQLFEAYSDHKKTEIKDLAGLTSWNDLKGHYDRQRELFYHAESLRNFARDTVPPGTFEDLQNEVFEGVVDIANARHSDAYERLNSVTFGASSLQLTSNPLISVTKVHDKKGICHQLANDDKIVWKKS